MNSANPTSLRLGMSGTLAGKSYHVAGRVLLGMEEGGETYYWNEFNLVSDGGESALLVFEETEAGGEWKFFVSFEPSQPLSATEAATKRVGDALAIDRVPCRVTLVDESRVYHIEGKAPEGVEVGDVAHYFNAESDDMMIVVSWTGMEVEYFRGANLPPGAIGNAFGISETSSLRRSHIGSALRDNGGRTPAPSRSTLGPTTLVALFVLLVGSFVMLAAAKGCSAFSRRPVQLPQPVSAPGSPLQPGARGTIAGVTWKIQEHQLVKIAEVGRTYWRHEYRLLEANERESLLINGFKPGANDWIHFIPVPPPETLSPHRAAALKQGDTVNVDGITAGISWLFQAVVDQSDAATGDRPTRPAGDVSFGWGAESGRILLEARWTEREITFHRGIEMKPKDVSAAFGVSLK